MVQEATILEKDFPEVILSILARLILFIYTGWFPRTFRSQQPDSDGNPFFMVRTKDLFASIEDNVELELKLYTRMYAVADKFLLEDLKEMSIRRFCTCFSKYCPTKDDWCRTHRDGHRGVLTTSLAELVYNSTPGDDRDLRDILLTFFLRDLRQLDCDHRSMPIYRDLIFAIPELAYDLLANGLRYMRFKCTTCQNSKFWILAPRCECGEELKHSWECKEDDRDHRRCPKCGRTGCLEWADAESDGEADDDEADNAEVENTHRSIEDSTTTLVGWDNSAAW